MRSGGRVRTGGTALADLLRAPTTALTTLKLGWNVLRLQSATELCLAVAGNKSLTYLDLGSNR